MNKGIVIGIVIAVAIAISFGMFMTSDDTIQPTKIDEITTEAEEVRIPKSYSITLTESMDMKSTP